MFIVIGLTMIAVTLGIHAYGSGWWLKRLSAQLSHREDSRRKPNVFTATITTGSYLLGLHLVEALLWAAVYLSPVVRPAFDGLESALYFSLVTFSTLGYGDITLAPGPRLLAGMEAMVGILVFGMSTALLMTVIQRIWSRHS